MEQGQPANATVYGVVTDMEATVQAAYPVMSQDEYQRRRAYDNAVVLLAAGLHGHVPHPNTLDPGDPEVRCGCGLVLRSEDAWCLHAAEQQVPQWGGQ